MMAAGVGAMLFAVGPELLNTLSSPASEAVMTTSPHRSRRGRRPTRKPTAGRDDPHRGGVVVLALVVGLVAVLLPSSPTPAPCRGRHRGPGRRRRRVGPAAQTELATRPMPSLPEGAALPQPLSADSPGRRSGCRRRTAARARAPRVPTDRGRRARPTGRPDRGRAGQRRPGRLRGRVQRGRRPAHPRSRRPRCTAAWSRSAPAPGCARPARYPADLQLDPGGGLIGSTDPAATSWPA